MPIKTSGPLRIEDMSPRQLETYERVLHAVNLSRRYGTPLDATAREAGTSLQTILKYARPALKPVGDRWTAKTSDRLRRRIRIYGDRGSFYVVVPSSGAASRISEFHNAVRRFVQTGDDSKLRAFEGKFVVDMDGKRHYFVTDSATIRRLARAGQFRFESIY